MITIGRDAIGAFVDQITQEPQDKRARLGRMLDDLSLGHSPIVVAHDDDRTRDARDACLGSSGRGTYERAIDGSVEILLTPSSRSANSMLWCKAVATGRPERQTGGLDRPYRNQGERLETSQRRFLTQPNSFLAITRRWI